MSVLAEPSSFDLAEMGPHTGEWYVKLLGGLHQFLQPRTYLEIGTLRGGTLKLATCRSIAIDPKFQLTSDVIGSKKAVHFFQVESDQFFKENDAETVLGAPIDLAFLDGLHEYEALLRDFLNTERSCKKKSIIIMHDCLPTNLYHGRRDSSALADLREHVENPGWWAGDVWKTIAILQAARPDLQIYGLDAPPTGLVCVTNLDPASTVLKDNYAALVEGFSDPSRDVERFRAFHAGLEVYSTSRVIDHELMSEPFGS